MSLLDDMNYYKYPDAHEHVFIVQGIHGELYVTVRPGEAWGLWAETHGYFREDWEAFVDDFEDQMEWSNDQRDVFIDEGGSLKCVEIIGYYRDEKDYL